MAYFPDKSPQQSLLETAEIVMVDYHLTSEELVVVLLDVIAAINDPFEHKSQRIKHVKKVLPS